MSYDYGEKLDAISGLPFYCAKLLLPGSTGLALALYHTYTSGFLAFSLASKVIIISCAIVMIAVMLAGLLSAHGNRLEIYQRGLVFHKDGYASGISYKRVGRFEWKEHVSKGAFITHRVHTCSILEKDTGKCLAQLTSNTYSHMGAKMSKLEHKLRI